ncbi:MAG: ABC transporter permease subunit [Ilumatobacter sp.]|uniref:ABC transporter permease n=1 Tax=Ilumatobacter sp. TaxID=1967498 RepID=UPI00260D4E8A|nr:ABC transporter permease subunit [Ilumatobacter sp.]MDJ0769091.1 ABC transporter permease subunit [Ilumatobacter sp.]
MFVQAPDDPGFGDNEVLDEFTIPFGSWIEQAVNWVTLNLDWLLDAIAWPFEFLLKNIVDRFLLEIPWVWLVLIMFLLAWLVRNLTVAVGAGIGLVICGLLGNEYWIQTARTIGFIVVAVVICVIIGIPVGILAGRIDGVWSVIRPTLDAMQVIHSFVYLLPFIYFWGVGRIGATMATMVFALPPLIRLTNLGIRQVPEDVVEAARAYGAPERRVLIDVQLPLARAAILTGINQTLLLAFSMLGVAAIMGAGGLGQLLFRALGQQDVSLAASSGLAFFLLAVILDRIAQPTGAAQANLFSRIVGAWRARRTPEMLLDDPTFNPEAHLIEPPAEEPEDEHEGHIAPVAGRERQAIMGVIAGAVLTLVSVFLTWSQDSGLVTGYSRRDDQDLAGESFNGLAASGGSWFGIFIVLLALVALAGAITMLVRPGAGGRWLAPDGVLFAALGALGTAVAYWLIQPPDLAVGHSHGLGVYVAIVGGLGMTVAAALWVAAAPYGPRRPLKPKVVAAPIVLAVVAVLLSVIAIFSSWTLDERQDAVITPEIQAELDEIIRQEAAGEIESGVAASRIQTIRASAVADEAIVIDGMSSEGSGLGIWALIFTVLAAAGALVTAGAAGLDDRRQWIGGIVAMGLGMAVVGIFVGWTGSLARATDPNFASGVGTMVAGLGGVFAFLAGRLVVGGFERSRVYADSHVDAAAPTGGSGAPRSIAIEDPVSSTIAP